ncbi:hypothetical protein ACIQHU_39330 [Streptomyces tendae]|uniref:hypothetical protein n=1 Tax=Streptomyces tendae TaxID=1932 RepID=UPI0038097F54
MSHRPHSEPTAVYRLYDATGILLYVGASWNPEFRWEQHRTRKHWAHLVTRRTEEWHPDRPTALAAEKTAIATEKPVYDNSWRHSQTGDRPEWLDSDGKQAVVAALTAEIGAGKYAVGHVLQTGPVGRRFDVARATASSAMTEMVNQGLLKRWYHGRYRVLASKPSLG